MALPYQVGDTLFKLHRSFLCRDAESLFKSLFSLPRPGGTKAAKELSDLGDEDYIPIPDVDARIFTVFVQMVYSRYSPIHLFALGWIC